MVLVNLLWVTHPIVSFSSYKDHIPGRTNTRVLPLILPCTRKSHFSHYRRFHTVHCVVDEKQLGLTPELAKLVKTFATAPDSKLRIQQLLYLAQTVEPLPFYYKVNENKVQGCLSTVHVVAFGEEGKIYFKGDSDAQLTKGLLALLIKGLSGYTVEEIEKVNPDFIKVAGLSISLTPGRNNGFLNMLQTMKKKAREAFSELRRSTSSAASGSQSGKQTSVSLQEAESKNDTDNKVFSERPIYSSIVEKLGKLKPSALEVQDESWQHAGHQGVKGSKTSETHFSVYIVSEAFEGISPVKRHQLVYTLLNQEFQQGLHALRINAKTPSEIDDAETRQ
eukprot:jgi/Galph1/179/GphlegSOOS_G4908.1